MAPRKPKPAPEQADIEDAIKATLPNVTPADLIGEYRKIDDWADVQDKAYAAHMKPHRDRMEQIKQTLHAMAIEQHVNGFPTDNGTAYISEIRNHKIDPEAPPYVREEDGTLKESHGRDAVLDLLLDNWDRYGNEFLVLSLPKAFIDQYIQDNGHPPPGVSISTLQRLNIRKS